MDGYNIIKNSDALAELPLEGGRRKLITILETRRPQGSVHNTVTVVFDGQAGVGPFPNPGPVKVVFSCGQSADEKIKQMVGHAGAKKATVVVTDDRAIQYYVRSLGAEVLSVRDFWHARVSPEEQSRPTPRNPEKRISRVQEMRITDELSRLWLKPRKRNHDPQ
ncbi:MAG: NYN domain-containing protein [Candidatus Omnitrophota bacterium]